MNKLYLIFIVVVGFLLTTPVFSQSDSTQLIKADSLFKQKEYKKAQKLYTKFALQNESIQALYSASLCYEQRTGNSHCELFWKYKHKGFVMQDPDLLFYGCPE